MSWRPFQAWRVSGFGGWMRPLRLSVLIPLLALAVTACGIGSTGGQRPTPTPSATPVPCTSWRVIPSPNAMTFPDNHLLALSALSPTSAWAVGTTFVEDGKGGTLVEVWDGVAWKVASSPNPDAAFRSVLNGVVAVSPNDVWAVGSNLSFPSGPEAQTETLIEHWNGAQWSIVPSPSVSSTSYTLSSVAAVAPNNIWAVGSAVMDDARLPLIERWDGATWRVVAGPPLPGATESALNAVAAIPTTTQAWAVGFVVNGPRPAFEQALIEWWDGTAWRAVSSAAPTGAKSSILKGIVALSPTDAYAVGDYTPGDSNLRQPFVERWNGVSWQVVSGPTPSGFEAGTFLGVAASGSQDVRVLGSFFVGGSGNGSRMVGRWDGAAWQFVASPAPADAAFISLDAIASDRMGTFWAVGMYQGPTNLQTLVERCP
jgi:hypothetical protein